MHYAGFLQVTHACACQRPRQVEDAQRQLSAALGEVAGAEASLASKLDKRRSELERCEKRLATLTGVRPAYMDEYERLTGELQVGCSVW